MTQLDGTGARLVVEGDATIPVIRLNYPDKLNALDLRTIGALRDLIVAFSADTSIRAAVITGTGDRAFCSGVDIEALEQDLAGSMRLIETLMGLYSAIETARMPVIAAVNGLAFGPGFELVLACDLAVVANRTRFAFPEAQLGLAPGAAIHRLVRAIGAPRTRELLMAGRQLSADEALQLGMVVRVVQPQWAMEEATSIAQTIAGMGPLAIEFIKLAINSSSADAAASKLAISALFATADHAEGVRAWRERRVPRFRRR